jgi:flavin-dependent dehydrogenase
MRAASVHLGRTGDDTMARIVRSVEVVVVGAGPAGSATARRLAQAGLGVVLVERSQFEASRVGESLAPAVQPLLRELGVWQEFLALRPLPSWGTRSLWGGAEAQSHSHLFSPYGCGWHVDRRAFDRMLASSAAAAGALLLDGHTFNRCVSEGGMWRAELQPAGAAHADPVVVTARVLIDATGRRAQLARSLGAQRLLFDRLVGVATRWAGAAHREAGHLLVEAVEPGWWYSAPLPAAEGEAPEMVAMLMTDADLCARGRLATAAACHGQLRHAQATQARLGPARPLARVQVHCAGSQRLRREALRSDVPPWLAVGDAALAVDPVSGSGVLRALRTARAAAGTVRDLLEGGHSTREELDAYERARDEECTTYLVERARYYAAETRFDTPFWQRRRLREAATAA